MLPFLEFILGKNLKEKKKKKMTKKKKGRKKKKTIKNNNRFVLKFKLLWFICQIIFTFLVNPFPSTTPSTLSQNLMFEPSIYLSASAFNPEVMGGLYVSDCKESQF